MSKPFKVLICSFTFFVLECFVASIRQSKVAPEPAETSQKAQPLTDRGAGWSTQFTSTPGAAFRAGPFDDGVCSKKGESGYIGCATSSVSLTTVAVAPADDATCLVMESIRVGTDPALIGTGWRARMHNSCPQATTKNIHVRLAFYDAGNYRSGFTDFQILPMKPGERVKVEGFVSTDKGAVSAKLFQKTTNPADLQ